MNIHDAPQKSSFLGGTLILYTLYGQCLDFEILFGLTSIMYDLFKRAFNV